MHTYVCYLDSSETAVLEGGCVPYYLANVSNEAYNTLGAYQYVIVLLKGQLHNTVKHNVLQLVPQQSV